MCRMEDAALSGDRAARGGLRGSLRPGVADFSETRCPAAGSRSLAAVSVPGRVLVAGDRVPPRPSRSRTV